MKYLNNTKKDWRKKLKKRKIDQRDKKLNRKVGRYIENVKTLQRIMTNIWKKRKESQNEKEEKD